MDLIQLRYFQAVAKIGNMSKAARELHVTQPNLSRSIARLEDDIGVPLFEHRKGHIELNDYGRVFLSGIDAAFGELDKCTQTIRRMYDVDQNILSLASNIPSYLPDKLPQFVLEHGQIGIRQFECDTETMTGMLLERTIEMGISYEEISHSQLVFRKLEEQRYVIAVSMDNPLSAQESVSVAALSGETFVCDANRLGLDRLREICGRYGFTPNVNFEIQSTPLIYSLVNANRGIAVIPLGMACTMLHEHADHRIRLLDIDEALPPILIGIVTRKNEEETKSMAVFGSYIKACLQEENRLIRDMGYAEKRKGEIDNV